MLANSWTLGEFGDERLVKRGVCFSRGWLRGKASAFVGWRAGDGARLLGFLVFSRIPE